MNYFNIKHAYCEIKREGPWALVTRIKVCQQQPTNKLEYHLNVLSFIIYNNLEERLPINQSLKPKRKKMTIKETLKLTHSNTHIWEQMGKLMVWKWAYQK